MTAFIIFIIIMIIALISFVLFKFIGNKDDFKSAIKSLKSSTGVVTPYEVEMADTYEDETAETTGKWHGVVTRCAICGGTSQYGVVKYQKYYLCEEHQGFRHMTQEIATCRCGYTFFPGMAHWYLESKYTAECPNCGIQLAGSGAFITDMRGSSELL